MAALEPKRILHVARRVVRRNIKGVEIVIFGFNLRAVQYGEAEGPEQVFNLPLDLRDRMQAAGFDSWRGDSKIEPLGVEPFRQRGPVELRFAPFPSVLESLLRR